MGWGIKRKLVVGSIVEYYYGDMLIYTDNWNSVIKGATIFSDDRDIDKLIKNAPNGYVYTLVRMGRYGE